MPVSQCFVIPAEAGIQPCCHSRESGNPGVEWYRAPRARDLNSYLRVAPPLHPGFLSLLVQRKHDPRMARLLPALRASGTAMARRHLRVLAGHARDPARAEYGSPIGSLQASPVFEPEARFSAPGELASTRWGEERKGEVARSGVSFSLMTFSWTSKRQFRWDRNWTAPAARQGAGQGRPASKSPAVGQPPTIMRRRRRHKTRCRGRAPVLTLGRRAVDPCRT